MHERLSIVAKAEELTEEVFGQVGKNEREARGKRNPKRANWGHSGDPLSSVPVSFQCSEHSRRKKYKKG